MTLDLVELCQTAFVCFHFFLSLAQDQLFDIQVVYVPSVRYPVRLWSEFPLGDILKHWRHSSLLRCGKTNRDICDNKVTSTIFFLILVK